VVDSESTDRTREVAARFRRGALSSCGLGPASASSGTTPSPQATNLWVLVLAADEWLTEDAAREVRAVLEARCATGTSSCGSTAFTGAFRPVGLASRPDSSGSSGRTGGSFEGGHVHESVQMEEGCRVQRLRHPLLHLTYRSIREFLDRMNRYTDLAARTMKEDGRRFSLFQLATRPPRHVLQVLRAAAGRPRRDARVPRERRRAAGYVFLKIAKRWSSIASPHPRFLAAGRGRRRRIRTPARSALRRGSSPVPAGTSRG